jgi:hypothetical protein
MDSGSPKDREETVPAPNGMPSVTRAASSTAKKTTREPTAKKK